MFLTITSTAAPATDLGFLLHKHPGKAQSFDVSVGQAHVFYPETGENRCTAALLLEVDPVGLVRGRRSAGRFRLSCGADLRSAGSRSLRLREAGAVGTPGQRPG